MVTLWFDKDGVLAQYDYCLYEPDLGSPAPWLVRNAHVFRTIEEYPNLCEAFRMLYKETHNVKTNERLCNMRVITQVHNGVTLSEQVLDGVLWCEQHLGLRQRDFYATAVNKVCIPIQLTCKLTKEDILLDDYTPNLRAWREAGGTAIKVLNEINSTTDEFPYFYNRPDATYLYVLLKQLVGEVAHGKRIPNGQYAPNAVNVQKEVKC